MNAAYKIQPTGLHEARERDINISIRILSSNEKLSCKTNTKELYLCLCNIALKSSSQFFRARVGVSMSGFKLPRSMRMFVLLQHELKAEDKPRHNARSRSYDERFKSANLRNGVFYAEHNKSLSQKSGKTGTNQ